MFGNHKNITPITVILLSSKLENLKKNFEARWGWNFFRGKSRVPRPRQSLVSRKRYFEFDPFNVESSSQIEGCEHLDETTDICADYINGKVEDKEFDDHENTVEIS